MMRAAEWPADVEAGRPAPLATGHDVDAGPALGAYRPGSGHETASNGQSTSDVHAKHPLRPSSE